MYVLEGKHREHVKAYGEARIRRKRSNLENIH